MGDSSKTRTALFFLAPALLSIGIFFLLAGDCRVHPELYGFDIYSLANWKFARFVGLENYAAFSATLLLEGRTGTRYTSYSSVESFPSPPRSLLHCFSNQNLCGSKEYFARLFYSVLRLSLRSQSMWRFVYHPRYGSLNYVLSLSE